MLQTQTSTIASQPGQVYTDLNGLQGIRALGKTDEKAALMQVAKQFESMFVGMMLNSMRQANKVFEEESLFNSPESDFYQKMYDEQLSLSLSGDRGMGLAGVIYRQMMGNFGKDQSLPEAEPAALDDHGEMPVLFQHKASPALQNALQEVDTELEKIRTLPDEAAGNGEQAGEEAASGSGNKGKQFSSAHEFVAALYPHAQAVADELAVDPRAIIAQAALETGWGKYVISDDQGRNSFNFFGIKADSRWQGNSVEVATHEYRSGVKVQEQAHFRAYGSIEEGLRDYGDFLRSASRYQQAIGQGLTSDRYGYALQEAGYATDPQYGAKIQRISGSETLNEALDAVLNKVME